MPSPYSKLSPDFVAIVGPTASGKSSFAIRLAKAINGSIVCCDSIQLYRGFNIGSAKPPFTERSEVPHYLFDSLDWNEACDAAIYATAARRIIGEIKSKGSVPIVVGGTGLYLRALLGDAWDEDIPSDYELRAKLSARPSSELFEELITRDPRRASQLHVNDRYRVIRALEINILTGAPVKVQAPGRSMSNDKLVVFCNPDRDFLRDRIKARTKQMLSQGFVDEVKQLLRNGVASSCKPMQSIGYKQVVAMLEGAIPVDELETRINVATSQYAKRQVTWFKKVPFNVELKTLDSIDNGVTTIQRLLRPF